MCRTAARSRTAPGRRRRPYVWRVRARHARDAPSECIHERQRPKARGKARCGGGACERVLKNPRRCCMPRQNSVTAHRSAALRRKRQKPHRRSQRRDNCSVPKSPVPPTGRAPVCRNARGYPGSAHRRRCWAPPPRRLRQPPGKRCCPPASSRASQGAAAGPPLRHASCSFASPLPRLVASRLASAAPTRRRPQRVLPAFAAMLRLRRLSFVRVRFLLQGGEAG